MCLTFWVHFICVALFVDLIRGKCILRNKNNKSILEIIEAEHWDYEQELIPKSVEYVNHEQLIMIKNNKVPSIYTNKVVRFAFQENLVEEVEKIISYYGNTFFAWWLPQSQFQNELGDLLKEYGFGVEDTYKGMAMRVEEWDNHYVESSFVIREVELEEQIQDLVKVSAIIWNYDEKVSAQMYKQ
jgi:hypothetical protein